ncbi:glycosyltransferase family 9 protein [Vampirovibrio sp.]|uniref:glycosyltransferase family 9 protein n=1 Tax=Vampirovibrio sp. TaxID=2717857 RepID=UPI003594895E
MRPESLQKIAFINFGGIGDEILFAPVISEIKRYIPQAHTTLFLEDRSSAVSDLLEVDHIIPLNVQGQSRLRLFFQLWNALRKSHFDVVISSGSSPFIPVLLFLSGIPLRVGFQTGPVSQALLTTQAPLAPKHDRKGYAAAMYFALAQHFLQYLLKTGYQPTQPILPQLKPPPPEDQAWAQDLMHPKTAGNTILIHPGVSTISIQKNILKSWPASHWAALILQLCQEGHSVYLAGGPDDRDSVEEIQRNLPPNLAGFTNLYGQTKNLRQLGALILEADLLLCVDSSPMHLAVGYQKPAVALFGPTDEQKLLPPHDARFIAVTAQNLDCRPCLWDVRNQNCATSECLNVPVETMLAAVRNTLATCF